MSRTFHHSRKWGRLNKWKRPHSNAYGVSPGWWVRMFMHVPARSRRRKMLRLVLRDGIDVDNTAFDLGSRKPHNYYW